MLTIMRHIRHAAFLGLFALAPAAPTIAATVVYSDNLPAAALLNPVATGASVTGASGLTTVLSQNVTGTITNVRRSPWDAVNSSVSPTATNAFYSAVQNGMAYFNLGAVQGGVSFVWGTPGPQNVFELFLNGVSQLKLTGSNANGPNGVNYSRLTTISDVRFDRMEFTAAKPAFEFANLNVAAVPLPAGGLLLLAGLGGLVLVRRRSMA